jgi:hypothetical protein
LAFWHRLGVQALDPADNQAGGGVVLGLLRGERGEGGLGDFGFGDPALLVGVPDGVAVVGLGNTNLGLVCGSLAGA